MIDLAQREDAEDLVLEALEDAEGFVKFDVIMNHVVADAVTRVHTALDKLVSAGTVEKDHVGRRWRLVPVKKFPVVVAEVPGDPNFRRGGR
ncbi:MAG: hypothetical protein U9R15_01390 [Chloroflexota bacterium]|nr:hypothetical protein [Chloroflexota bacterium]